LKVTDLNLSLKMTSSLVWEFSCFPHLNHPVIQCHIANTTEKLSVNKPSSTSKWFNLLMVRPNAFLMWMVINKLGTLQDRWLVGKSSTSRRSCCSTTLSQITHRLTLTVMLALPLWIRLIIFWGPWDWTQAFMASNVKIRCLQHSRCPTVIYERTLVMDAIWFYSTVGQTVVTKLCWWILTPHWDVKCNGHILLVYAVPQQS